MDPVPGTRGGHDFRDPSLLLGQDRERVPMMFIGTSRTVLFRAQKTTGLSQKGWPFFVLGAGGVVVGLSEEVKRWSDALVDCH